MSEARAVWEACATNNCDKLLQLFDEPERTELPVKLATRQ
jgi:hypothetical protein